MARYGMTCDEKLCVTCNACVVACKNENAVPKREARCWTAQIERGRFPHVTVETRSERCNHCENAPCVSVCPTRASHYGPDGLVVVDRDKCIGCKVCTVACPYEVRYLHPDGFVDKCSFCQHRVEKGQEPACVAVCPTDALTFGDLDDPHSKIFQLMQARGSKVLKEEEKTRPKMFFLP